MTDLNVAQSGNRGSNGNEANAMAEDSGSEYSDSDVECDNGCSNQAVNKEAPSVDYENESRPSSSSGRDVCKNVQSHGIVVGKCLEQPTSFLSSRKQRPIYMCTSEMRVSGQLDNHIENWERQKGGMRLTDPDGTVCVGIIGNSDGTEAICTGTMDG